MTGFMGMGMAMNAGGGMNAQNLFAMGQQQQQQAQQQAAQQPTDGPDMARWKCSCGRYGVRQLLPELRRKEARSRAGGRRLEMSAAALPRQAKFCPECGSPETR